MRLWLRLRTWLYVHACVCVCIRMRSMCMQVVADVRVVCLSWSVLGEASGMRAQSRRFEEGFISEVEAVLAVAVAVTSNVGYHVWSQPSASSPAARTRERRHNLTITLTHGDAQ